MSQWNFNGYTLEVDFTDADFMDKFERAYDVMQNDFSNVQQVGRVSEVIRNQCKVFDSFFDRVFGKDTAQKMFKGKMSMELRVAACNSLYELRNSEQKRYDTMITKYRPNRQQRRHGKRS